MGLFNTLKPALHHRSEAEGSASGSPEPRQAAGQPLAVVRGEDVHERRFNFLVKTTVLCFANHPYLHQLDSIGLNYVIFSDLDM